MNCFGCASLDHYIYAVAVCADCGAALCRDHAHVTAHWLIRTAVIKGTVDVEPLRARFAAVCARLPTTPISPGTPLRPAEHQWTLSGPEPSRHVRGIDAARAPLYYTRGGIGGT